MEFKKEKEELSFIEQQLNGEPCINVISKEDFEDRVKKVFTILWEKLSKSFGPGGAGTFISLYPNYYNTKDGFTIMKNIAFDKKIDQVISDMVMTICSRLNFTVGDGTTTATIATKSTYDAYMAKKDFFEAKHILPRDILAKFETYKNEIITRLEKEAVNIRSNNPEELRKNIEKVVYVSSNGNDEITEMIASLYEELMYPAISCVLSKDGTMKKSIIEGYKLDVSLTDKIYINNDNNTMHLSSTDVIMFDHKVTSETYEKILKPLSMDSGARGRHLLCIAPFYDERALGGVIRTDLNAEYQKKRDINLILTVCTKATGYSRVLLDDLAMLMNTMLISPAMETEIIKKIDSGIPLYKLLDLDNREIEGINVAVVADKETHSLSLVQYSKGLTDTFGNEWKDNCIRVGYCSTMDLGLKESTFSGFFYNQDVYDKYLSTAKEELREVQKKCEKIGTFSLDMVQKQQRVYALGLKTGLIEVGSTSELSQGYLKDTVDDAIKAAASAYNNGVVLGCNVTLMKVISECINSINNMSDDCIIDAMLLAILLEGYSNVYKTVMSNVFDTIEVDIENKDSSLDKDEQNKIINRNIDTIENVIREKTRYKDFEFDRKIAIKMMNKYSNIGWDIHSIIVIYSIESNSVFDVTTGKFNQNVINSAETDKEIVKATIDLLSLIITGNQLVLC